MVYLDYDLYISYKPSGPYRMFDFGEVPVNKFLEDEGGSVMTVCEPIQAIGAVVRLCTRTHYLIPNLYNTGINLNHTVV